jgi:hypothetical protein
MFIGASNMTRLLKKSNDYWSFGLDPGRGCEWYRLVVAKVKGKK